MTESKESPGSNSAASDQIVLTPVTDGPQSLLLFFDRGAGAPSHTECMVIGHGGGGVFLHAKTGEWSSSPEKLCMVAPCTMNLASMDIHIYDAPLVRKTDARELTVTVCRLKTAASVSSKDLQEPPGGPPTAETTFFSSFGDLDIKNLPSAPGGPERKADQYVVLPTAASSTFCTISKTCVFPVGERVRLEAGAFKSCYAPSDCRPGLVERASSCDVVRCRTMSCDVVRCRTMSCSFTCYYSVLITSLYSMTVFPLHVLHLVTCFTGGDDRVV
jgi:hypothetical protein